MEDLNFLFQKIKISFRRNYGLLMIYKKERWYYLGLLILILFMKCFYYGKYYALLYIIGFYYIQNMILFITPKDIPSIHDEDDENDIYDIPETINRDKNDEEAKPIIRKLSEFHLWEKINIVTIIAFLCSFFDFFNFNVYYPLLLFYFIWISIIIIMKQRKHMKKYNYSLDDFFKNNKINK